MRIDSPIMPPINATNYAKNKESPNTINNENTHNKNAQHIDSLDSRRDNAPLSQDRRRLDEINRARVDSANASDVNGVEQVGIEEGTQKGTHLEEHKDRITYGLKVIELMSEEEYQAFLWATQDLSESEKILMAQSLYRFTSFYQGKNFEQGNKETDMQKLNAHRAFGVEHSMMEDFIQRYKNAYSRLMQSQLDVQG